MPVPLRCDFDSPTTEVCAEDEGRGAGAAAVGAGGDLRGRVAHRGGADRRRDAADRAGLGVEVQRERARRADRPEGARAAARG